MTQGTKGQRVKTEKRDSAKSERSQSATSERKVHGGRDDRVETTVPAGEGGGEARGDTSPAGAQAVAENVVPGQEGPPIIATKPGGSQGEVGTVVQAREGMVQTGQPPTSGVNPNPCRMNKAGSASQPRSAASPVRTTELTLAVTALSDLLTVEISEKSPTYGMGNSSRRVMM